jgi:ferredoxin
VIFGEQLRTLERKHDGFKLHEQHTQANGRFAPIHLDDLCPDWKERIAFVSGPAEMLDALSEHWDEHCDCDQLHMERFQPVLAQDIEEGKGGTIVFKKSDCRTECDGATPVLVAGEDAGLELPYGCREGICHTCVGTLVSGKLRDLRNGDIVGNEGEHVRTCINAPEGPVEIDL